MGIDAEGYSIHIVCDNYPEQSYSHPVLVDSHAEIYGHTKQEAHKALRERGWTKRRGRWYCPYCSDHGFGAKQ